MIIQHNIMALNSYRQLGGNYNALAKNLEKLSSGYRINRAGDDAAGLAISEKMRAQIKGLETAIKNSQDGISLIQTAEGALTEVHAMLNRMVELATQASNGIYDDQVDRKALDDEFQQLKQEIDRISKATNFNGKNLLDGTLDGADKTKVVRSRVLDLVTTTALAAGGTAGAYVLGTDTIPHANGIPAGPSSFTIDLGDLRTIGSAATDTITVAVGGMTFTLTASYDGEFDNVGNIAKSLHKQMTNAANASANTFVTGSNTFDITNAQDFSVVLNSDNTITVTQLNTPTKSTEVLTVSMTVSAAAAAPTTTLTGTGGSMDWGSYNVGTTNNIQGNFDGGGNLASTVLDLTKINTFINDGTVLSIGGVDYTFAVDKDSKFTNAKNLIDLTAYTALEVQAASTATPNIVDLIGAKITEAAAKNQVFTVGYNNATNNLTFHEILGQNKAVLDTVEKVHAQFGFYKDSEVFVSKAPGLKLNLQVADTGDAYNIIGVSVKDMSTIGLGIQNLNIRSYEAAVAAVGTIAQQGNPGTIKGAINVVSAQRAELGALQNRLEHTINNLGVTTENLIASESRIRDTDMAKEMMYYTKNNILVQAAQAMLAQANMVPQGVLQLLR